MRPLPTPSPRPPFLGGLRNGFALSVTIAVVGRWSWVGRRSGELTQMRNNVDTAGMFVIIIILCTMATLATICTGSSGQTLRHHAVRRTPEHVSRSSPRCPRRVRLARRRAPPWVGHSVGFQGRLNDVNLTYIPNIQFSPVCAWPTLRCITRYRRDDPATMVPHEGFFHGAPGRRGGRGDCLW